MVLGAHGLVLGVEGRLGHKTHRPTGPRVLGAATGVVGGDAPLHVDGVARVPGPVGTFEHVHIVFGC